MAKVVQQAAPVVRRRSYAIRGAILRGLGVVLPPLLTVVIFLWVGRTIQQYLLHPMTDTARYVLVRALSDVRPPNARVDGGPTGNPPVYQIAGKSYRRLPSREYVPVEVAETVLGNLDDLITRDGQPVPRNGYDMYVRYVEMTYLEPQWVVPAFLLLFFAVMYLLGRFLAAGVGRVLLEIVERAINSLPLIRNVYSSVKQVTDLMLNNQEMRVLRVVAVQYPRPGLWAVAFVTGEGLGELHQAAGEPVLVVLVPASPMCMTGYTMQVRRSEVMDLDMTVDQACQFIISCGVVVPEHQALMRIKQAI